MNNTVIESIIRNSHQILIVSSNPVDPDCIGSGLVMKKYVEWVGKKGVKLILPAKKLPLYEESFSYLPYFNEIEWVDTRIEVPQTSADTLILVDGGSLSQFFDTSTDKENFVSFETFKNIIHIDHHQRKEEISSTYLIHDEKASSTIELIIDRIVPSEFLDEYTSTLAYSALIGDTGNFMWNTSTTTFKVASLLREKGAHVDEVINYAFYNRKKEEFTVLAWCIQNAEYDDETKSIFLLLPKATITKNKFDENMMKIIKIMFNEGLSKYVKGYARGFYIYEESGRIRISARANNFTNTINLPVMLTSIGGLGGGHFHACGFEFTGSFDEVVNKIKETIKSEL